MTDTRTQLSIGTAWVAVSALAGVALTAYVKVNQVGPRTFWATDACPDPAVTCGVMPLVWLPAVLLAVGLMIAGAPAVLWLGRRLGGDATDG